MNPLIISRLIESGFELYLSLEMKDELLALIDGELKTILCTTACQDKDKSPILKKLDRMDSIDYVASVDPLTRTVWLVPSELLSEVTMIRLGKRYEDFIVPEPHSLSYEEQKVLRSSKLSSLKEQAKELAERMNK